MTAGVGDDDDRSPVTVEKPWTREEDKAFETALATAEAAEGRRRWEGIASWVPARTADEVRRHYELLVDDVKAIEEGRIELPAYGLDNEAEKGLGFVKGSSKGLSRSEQDRRKGIPWTEKEHKLFLIGLEKFGKGDWRSISRNYVTSRTPTQVASHAQKYFNRLNSANRDRRRTSIHDITADLSSSPKPNSAHTLTGAQMNHVGPAMVQGVAVYGQPVPGHGPVPAVGTPVMFPPQPVPGYAAPPYVVPAGYPAPPLGPPHNMNLH